MKLPMQALPFGKRDLKQLVHNPSICICGKNISSNRGHIRIHGNGCGLLNLLPLLRDAFNNQKFKWLDVMNAFNHAGYRDVTSNSYSRLCLNCGALLVAVNKIETIKSGRYSRVYLDYYRIEQILKKEGLI